MTKVNKGTKMYEQILNTFNSNYGYRGGIYEAYGKPSAAKVRAYDEILQRAIHTEGFNYDMRITGASSFTFSTMYSYTQNGKTVIVYDTPSYTRYIEV